jgi:hypothetical protein
VIAAYKMPPSITGSASPMQGSSSRTPSTTGTSARDPDEPHGLNSTSQNSRGFWSILFLGTAAATE